MEMDLFMNMTMIIKLYMKEIFYMEKRLEKEKNMIFTETYFLSVIIIMEKKTEKGKNLIMVWLFLKENIYMTI